MEHVKENFSNRMGFVLAAAASAVGLGNLWRFPYLADQYGGGLFLIVYVILVVTFGFTLMLTEITLGRKTGKSCIDAFGDLSKKHAFIGWLIALVPILIVPYYCVIGGWITKYFSVYLVGAGSDLAGSGYFNSFIAGMNDGILGSPVPWFLIFVALTILVVAFGVEKGVERISRILMPALLVMLIVISVYALTMPNAMDGLNHYLGFDFSKFSVATILEAMGQLFYSMSLAMGIMITYGAYMKKDVPIEASARNISLMDTSVALLAGLMIVPSVVIFTAGGVNTNGAGLMFVTLPQVFEAMPAGHIIGAVFFLLTIFAALTSAISLAETVVSVIRDKLKWTRSNAVYATLALIVGLGMLSCLGYGPLDSVHLVIGGADYFFLEIFDFVTNNVIMPIVAILTCLFIGYVVKPSFIIDEIESSGPFKSKNYYGVMIRYVCPLFLVLILIFGLASKFGVIG